MKKNKKYLFVSVHPDDETLGCGGTILKYKSCGEEIYWLIITDISITDGWNKEKVERRRKEINKVSKMYKFKETYNLKLPTTQLDKIPLREIIFKISKVIQEIQPEELFLINNNDIHSDHKIAFQALISCTKNFRYPSIKRILMYECLSETEFAPPNTSNSFMPNVFIDISKHIDEKIKIIKVYKSEIMKDNLPRSINAIKSLAGYRGSRIGVKYAEAFQLLFEKI